MVKEKFHGVSQQNLDITLQVSHGLNTRINQVAPLSPCPGVLKSRKAGHLKIQKKMLEISDFRLKE